MNATIAAQMTGADVLKLRKKRGTVIWALVVTLAPLSILYIVKAIEHSSDPLHNGPAGGVDGFSLGVRLLGGLFFGPLAAILIGAEAGVGDRSSGVFRDLVVTGRSRVALFASRVPAALAVMWSITLVAYAIIVAASFLFAGSLATPSSALILNGLGFLLLDLGSLCVLAVAFGALVGSKPATIIALIGWNLIASPLLASIASLGSARDWIFNQAIVHFSPVHLGDRAASVTMSVGTALLVLVVWLAVFLALGAWRTRTMDA
jgi:ABC-type transport system involved in multi-copper enzyme maturation permease subunit